LATNAAKYGALSSIPGKLQVDWRLSDGKLMLDWNETGGLATEAPSASGFGTRIILASIERQLRGLVAFDWRPEGLHCTISVPLSSALETVDVPVRHVGEHHAANGSIALNGASVMLVEDEAIVAMAVNESLSDLGFSVIGPFSRVSDACRALQLHHVDAAILDVNLAGEMVYPLADLLITQKIPFVFATGYGAESIESRFGHIPVLQKPIEKDMLTRIFVRPDTTRSAVEIQPVV
jgi:CheY-like chemotaxis protein